MASENVGDVADMKQQAFNQLAQGKRHLLVKDYSEAVTSLALACEYLAKIYGDTANECGEAYFNYGKALLELARTENGVLGMDDKPASDKVASEDEGDEDSNEAEEGPASSSKSDENGTTKNGTTENGNGTCEAESSGSNIKEAEAGGSGSEAATTTEGSDKNGQEKVEGEDEEDDEDEDEIPNLNLAWEILELAKIIYQRQADGDEAMELKLAEVNLKLGEVSLESENYLDATKDMKDCLNLQMKHLAPDDRLIAETYYQIGIAYSLANQFDESIEAFANCGKLLELRIRNLKDKIKEGVKPDGSNPFYSFQGEIEELEQLFPAIKEKIFDMQDFKNETMRAMFSHKQPDSSDPGAGSSKDPTPSVSSSSDAKPVSNISHLVRKKRKSESEEAEAVQAKRPCSSGVEAMTSTNDTEEPKSSTNNTGKEP